MCSRSTAWDALQAVQHHRADVLSLLAYLRSGQPDRLPKRSIAPRRRSRHLPSPVRTQSPQDLQKVIQPGPISDRLGRHREALDLLVRQAGIDDLYIGRVMVAMSERDRLDYLHQTLNDLNVVLTFATMHFSTSKSTQFACDLVLRRKRLAAEVEMAQRHAVYGNRYPHLRPRLDELDRLGREIERAT